MGFADSLDKKTQIPSGSAIWPRIGETAEGLLESRRFKVFVDASFIKSQAFRPFINLWHAKRSATPALGFYYIPSCEIQKLSREERSLLIPEDYRERFGDDITDCFAKIHKQDLRWNIVFLTTNGDAGYAVQSAARTNGLRLRWYGLDSNGKICALYSKMQQREKNILPKEPPFRITGTPVSCTRSGSVPNHVPKSGDKVFTKCMGEVISLKQALMTDHISVTYTTDHPDFFAKVYTIDALKIDMLEKKAGRMLQEKVDIPGVCWPTDILNDNSGCFVGILIPASKGIQLTRSVLNGTTGLLQFFPKWNKQDLCILSMTILDKICKMHTLGLLFGCINPATIYVAGAKEVYFVDTDCWQIEGFPALSRNQTFTPPELLRDNKVQMMYTMDQENYQIALLAFMLMMPGKFPYAKGENSNERDSIIDMAFPFSVGGGMRRSQDAERPSGIWRIVWDHLPYKMCDNFYNTFHSNGKYAGPGKRLKAKDWLEMTREFSDMLAAENRADSRELFPGTFRRDGKRLFVRCSICGQEHPDYYFMHSVYVQKEKVDIWKRGYRICLPCAGDQSNVSFRCECCGRQFYYTNRAKVLHEIGKSDFDFKNQKWCRDCKKQTVKCVHCGRETPIYQMREFDDRLRNQRKSVCGNCFKELIETSKRERENWKNSVNRWAICRDCHRSFAITNGDIEYFSKKGYSLPTRCPVCRKKRF